MRCDRLARSDHKVCRTLPPNPSCSRVVEGNKRGCYEFCDRQDRETPTPSSPEKSKPGIDI
jgi:hypothetical protein